MSTHKGRPDEDVCLIVHDFESYLPLTKIIDLLQSSIKKSVPEACDPKIGNHVTIVPPFFANKQLQFGILFGMELRWTGFASSQFDAEVSYKLSFFKNENCDYAYLPITFPKDYTVLVTKLRAQIEEHGRWYYDPTGEKWVPHITVSEAFGLADLVPASLSTSLSKGQRISVALPVEQPSLMRKVVGGWEKVRFESLRSK